MNYQKRPLSSQTIYCYDENGTYQGFIWATCQGWAWDNHQKQGLGYVNDPHLSWTQKRDTAWSNLILSLGASNDI